jgi:hypothetical protein
MTYQELLDKLCALIESQSQAIAKVHLCPRDHACLKSKYVFPNGLPFEVTVLGYPVAPLRELEYGEVSIVFKLNPD